MNKVTSTYNIRRYDHTNDRSLRPHSAADEYLLRGLCDQNQSQKKIAIYNDRFGYLSCHLNTRNPTVIITSKGQQCAIERNHKSNSLPIPQFVDPLSSIDPQIETAIIKAPKSLALLELFIQQVIHNSSKELIIIIAFMTRHFSPKLIELSLKYFESADQSIAIKKARLVTLTKKKQAPKLNLIDSITYKEHNYKQYWGVFSSKHIDYATQFLIENLEINLEDKNILDLASGNGVLAKEISLQLPQANIHLIDDSFLAVESAKLNLIGDNIHHHHANNLADIEENSLDLIVSNPPFHLEYELSINPALHLFIECFRCLKATGNFQLVANKHLNYLTHLKQIFRKVEITAENEKFIIYKCSKQITNLPNEGVY